MNPIKSKINNRKDKIRASVPFKHRVKRIKRNSTKIWCSAFILYKLKPKKERRDAKKYMQVWISKSNIFKIKVS